MISVQNYPATCKASAQPGRVTIRDRRTEQRAQALLSTEIAFIDNPEFRSGTAAAEILDQPTPLTEQPAANIPLGMPAHLQRMCSAPLLSAQQETELFRRMNYLKYRANVLRSQIQESTADPSHLDRVEQLIRCGEEVRNQILHANIRLVVSIAKKFADARNPFDDLLSEGIHSLVRAVDKFDYGRGFRFSTYATSVVRRDLVRLLRSSQKRRQRFATGTSEYLDSQSAVPLDDDQRVAENEWDQVSEGLQEMLGKLDRREQLIVRGRYGLDAGGRKVTFKVLGEQLGVSKERVRQLYQRAMQKLQRMVAQGNLGDTDFSI